MKGDFTGFTFVYNGHSYTTEELGITRVSDGDRYNEPLIPELEDKTIEIPGLDGSYYYGSDFKSRNFPIKIAYDSLNETQFRLMRQIFGVKHTGLLILDEAPYKQYRVKIASPPELDFVCFDERKRVASNTTTPIGVRVVERDDVPTDVSVPVTVPAQSTITYTLTDTPVGEITIEGATAWEEGTEELVTYTVEGNTYTITNNSEEEVTVNLSYQVLVHTITREDITPWEYVTDEQGNYVYERIYKGEGTIEFIAYYPFATQVYKTLDEYRNAIDDDGNPIYTNVDEWAEASGLLEDAEAYSGYDHINDITGTDSDGNCTVYNAGDIPTGMKIYIPFETSKPLENNLTITNESVLMDAYNTTHPSLTIESALEKQGSDTGLLINMENGLIEGVTGILSDLFGHLTYVTSGNIYNQYAIGMFFKIEPGESMIHFTEKPTGIRIFYNYLYF